MQNNKNAPMILSSNKQNTQMTKQTYQSTKQNSIQQNLQQNKIITFAIAIITVLICGCMIYLSVFSETTTETTEETEIKVTARNCVDYLKDIGEDEAYILNVVYISHPFTSDDSKSGYYYYYLVKYYPYKNWNADAKLVVFRGINDSEIQYIGDGYDGGSGSKDSTLKWFYNLWASQARFEYDNYFNGKSDMKQITEEKALKHDTEGIIIFEGSEFR